MMLGQQNVKFLYRVVQNNQIKI